MEYKVKAEIEFDIAGDNDILGAVRTAISAIQEISGASIKTLHVKSKD